MLNNKQPQNERNHNWKLYESITGAMFTETVSSVNQEVSWMWKALKRSDTSRLYILLMGIKEDKYRYMMKQFYMVCMINMELEEMFVFTWMYSMCDLNEKYNLNNSITASKVP